MLLRGTISQLQQLDFGAKRESGTQSWRQAGQSKGLALGQLTRSHFRANQPQVSESLKASQSIAGPAMSRRVDSRSRQRYHSTHSTHNTRE
jgi:hypothetical protein